MLLIERTWAVDYFIEFDFFIVIFHTACEFDLCRLAHVHTDEVEVSHFLPDDLWHVHVRLWHFPAGQYSSLLRVCVNPLPFTRFMASLLVATARISPFSAHLQPFVCLFKF